MPAPKKSPIGRTVRTFNWDSEEFQEGKIEDRNGSLSYIEFKNGDHLWIGNEQLEYLD